MIKTIIRAIMKPYELNSPVNKRRNSLKILIAMENSTLGVANVPIPTRAIYKTVSGTNKPTSTANSLSTKPPIIPKDVVNALGV